MESIGIIFCSQCGHKNLDNDSFCAKCGNKLRSVEIKKDNSTQNYNVTSNYKNYNTSTTFSGIENKIKSYTQNSEYQDYEECDINSIDLFLEKNQVYYHEKFSRIVKLRDKKTWNWAAFFFNLYWMVYRKMYLQAAVFYIIASIISMVPFIGSMLSLTLCIYFGIYGNSIYFDHINKNINEINTLYQNINEKQIMIMRKGGTNVVGTIVFAIGTIIISWSILIPIISSIY